MKQNSSSCNPEKIKRKRKVAVAVRVIVAILVTLAFAFPLYWMFVTSIKSSQEMYSVTPSLWPTDGIHWENYLTALTRVPLLKYMLNTIYVTAWQLFLQLTTGLLAAYGFARGKFPFRDALFVLVLGALMIPHQVTFVPIYMLVAKLNLMDTFGGLILPSSVSAYFIFMMRQNFMAVDQSYLDAGRIDGLGILGTIRYILIPMCRSSVVTVSFVTIMNGWNNYFWPKILSKSDSTRLISVGLVQLKNSWDSVLKASSYNVLMAAVLLSLIPIVFLFVVNQKSMLEGYSKAAMK